MLQFWSRAIIGGAEEEFIPKKMLSMQLIVIKYMMMHVALVKLIACRNYEEQKFFECSPTLLLHHIVMYAL